MAKQRKKLVKVMLDSGAFSAWNRGEELDLQEYIDYVHEHKHLIHSYVNMDVIPAGLGVTRTKAGLEEAAARSYENLQVIKKAGLSPIPVFHQGEDPKWLYRMLEDGETYIGVSSEKDLQYDAKRRWLDTIFSILTDAKGRPLIKTHGFGITKSSLLRRYPWTTVDSATWSLTPGFGTILVPEPNLDGTPNYSKSPIHVVMTGQVQKWISRQRMQFEGLGERHQEAVRRFLKEEVGTDITEARYLSTMRRRAVLIFFMRLAEHLHDVRFTEGREAVKKAPALARRKALPPDNLTIMFATNLNREWESMMTKAGCTTRLLSYYELRKHPTSILEQIVYTGMHGVGEYKKTIPKRANWESEHYRTFRRMKLRERFPDDQDVEEGPVSGT